MNHPPIVSSEEWQRAHEQLLVKEKAPDKTWIEVSELGEAAFRNKANGAA
jgi:predicted dithiol-disulfide oxidoreductase (DUF899 family)